jgi:glycosyltransferase involved in cell wall biosynthesis
VWGDEAALFVPPEDTGALVEALESLRRDEALRTRLAARARARALTYTPRRMAAAYLCVYAGLTGAPASRAAAREQVHLPESTSP